MLIIKLVLAILIGYVSWLLYGSPDTSLIGNLLIWGCTFFHIWIIIFNKEFFGLFGGDVFTYGMVNLGFNLTGFALHFISGLIILIRFDGKIDSIEMIPGFIWGLILIGILLSLLLPILSTRYVDPLPSRDDRRDFEPPRSN